MRHWSDKELAHVLREVLDREKNLTQEQFEALQETIIRLESGCKLQHNPNNSDNHFLSIY